jgi:hypothetical protein
MMKKNRKTWVVILKNAALLLFALVNVFGVKYDQQNVLTLEIKQEKGVQGFIVSACFRNNSSNDMYLNQIKGLQLLTKDGYQIGFVFEKDGKKFAPKFRSKIYHKGINIVCVKAQSTYCVNFELSKLFENVPQNCFLNFYYQNKSPILNDTILWTGYVLSNKLLLK